MLLFIATFFSVALLGFQQQNVIHGHYKAAALTSFCISITQFIVIHAVIVGTTMDIVFMGGGGALGITTSMLLHRKFFKRA